MIKAPSYVKDELTSSITNNDDDITITMIMMVLTALLLATLTTAAVDDTCMWYGLDIDQPGASCTDIYNNNPSIRNQSGYYLIKADHLFLAHCDKEDNGWMRVADFDASRWDECLTGWTGITVNNIRMCQSTSDAAGCYSSHLSVNGQAIVRYEVKWKDIKKALQMLSCWWKHQWSLCWWYIHHNW